MIQVISRTYSEDYHQILAIVDADENLDLQSLFAKWVEKKIGPKPERKIVPDPRSGLRINQPSVDWYEAYGKLDVSEFLGEWNLRPLQFKEIWI